MANIIWTPPDGWVEESGTHVTFKSPCDCSVAGSLVIGTKTYSIVDANGKTITGIGGAFVSGSILDFVLDCENLKAYLQNASSSDYVVAEAHDSSTWKWRKWNSGIAEIWDYWGVNTYHNVNVLSRTVSLPFALTAVDSVNATIMLSSDDNSSTSTYRNMKTRTTTSTIVIWCHSPAGGFSSGSSLNAGVFIKGRWK